MAGAWIDNGPVSLPPRILAYGAASLILLLAAAGVGLGMRAASRDSGAPDLGSPVQDDPGQAKLAARPTVQAPPAAPSDDAQSNADETADAAKSDNIAEKTAAAQEVQAKPAKAAPNIDEILASPTEKPPPAIKPATDEAPPPSAPVKTDVPF
ncbi:MAG: hypothetical protein ABI056_04100 [Caulobacteraceae bacterium]